MSGSGVLSGSRAPATDWVRKDFSSLPTCDSRSLSDGSRLDQYQYHASRQEHWQPDVVLSSPSNYSSNEHVDPVCSIAHSHSAIIASSNKVSHGNELIAAPRSKRCKSSTTGAHVGGSATPTSPTPNIIGHSGISLDSNSMLSSTVFDEITSLYRRLCVWPPAPWTTFQHVELPDQATLEHLLNLYYLHFDQNLPFWHSALIHRAEQHPVLIIAMSAIGSSYLEGADSVRTSLLEFGRRCLIFVQESTADSRLDSSDVCSAQLLQIVGMAYSEHENFRRRGLDSRRELAQILRICQRELKNCDYRSTATELDDNDAWLSWCQFERIVRLASSTWLVDCMLAYHFDSQPTLRLRDMRYPLPCAERLWSAKTAQEWKTLQANCTSQPTLGEAMQELCVEKRFPQELGEFARIIIIHGLYQRTWEVQRYFENPLSSWGPSVSLQADSGLLPELPVYLHVPPIAEVMSWQSAACNAVALMHWQATAKVGRQNGHEHATVLHLHLARILLLTPYVHIILLARAMSSGEGELDKDVTAESKLILRRWVGHHQKLARTATIHAGLIYWHVRRFSVSGFYEAHSVALAALVLWAFGTFSSGKPLSISDESNPSLTGHEEAEQSDDAMCEIILIDRPTDEELVQQFIEHGHSMRIHMTGVEDLYGPRGPESVLVQGCKLLSSLRWGASSSWLQLLQSLADR